MKITILSASTGNGHMSAAYALDAVFKARGHTVNTYDTLEFAPYAFRRWYGGGYEFIVRTRPALYGHLYHVSDERKFSFLMQTASDYVFLAKLRKLLEDERPDWVVCTHSLPQPRLAQLREELGFFRMAVVLTDHYPHLMWVRGNPDHFFVPSDWTREILEQRRAHFKGRITITGIPVHPIFAEDFDPAAIRAELGVKPDEKLVTLTSGGIGGGPFAQAIEAISALNRPMVLEVICGRNEQRKKQIEQLVDELRGSKVRIQVRGHITQDEMAKRMHASEVLISKPGGLTTSEALACGCAMLVYEPFLIPGQEEGNADFLVSSGAGVKAAGPEELSRVLTDLLNDPARVQTMRSNAKALGKPHAGIDIAEGLERINDA